MQTSAKGDRARRENISRKNCHLRHPVVILTLLCALFTTQVLAQQTASFTDSRGRTVLYRYSLKESWDPNVPRGVLIRFHGNNTGALVEFFNPGSNRQIVNFLRIINFEDRETQPAAPCAGA